MDFLRFLKTKLFLRHLGLAVALGIILLLGTMLWLRIYTHHGHTITVPDLTGLTEDEVSDVVSSRQLRYEVVDSIYSDEMPRGTVLKQNPSPHSDVKKNRRIFLTMNAENPETVTMPRLVGLSIRQARLALQNAGLTLGDIEYRPDYAINNVLQQMHQDSVIMEGTEIQKGSVIELVLGMGLSNETTRVPQLVGLSLDLARERIADFYLNIGAITYDEELEEQMMDRESVAITGEDPADTIQPFVWRQYPEYDEFRRLKMGMEVDIWLTTDSSMLPKPDSIPGFQIEAFDE